MNILIEVRHPHHVHVFRHVYYELKQHGHNIKVVAVDKEMSYPLLDRFNIPYEKVGVNKKGLLKKLFSILNAIFKFNRIAKQFKPDIFVGKASPTLAFVSFLRRKPYILFTDSENAKLLWTLISRHVSTFVSPSCYQKDFGRNHVRFDGYLELAYLQKDYYQPNQSIFQALNISRNEKYILIRFVSWNASHDIGQGGFDNEDKKQVVETLSKYATVFISSENELPDGLKKYKLNIEPDKIFDVMKYASLYIGEGATMASESVMLGTPAIYVNSIDAGTIKQQENDGLLFHYKSKHGLLEKSIELIIDTDAKNKFLQRSEAMLKEKINVTPFMVWIIENYPESVCQLQENPDYQYHFK